MNNIVRAVKATVLVMTMALLTTVGAANTNDAWLCVIKANDAALCEAIANNAALCVDMAEKEQWSKAMPACKAAAERGSIMPQFLLGNMYKAGHGVAQNYAQAVRWYELAAAQGMDAAQYNLGLMYGRGWGVAQDYVRAHMWFNLAAVSGDADSVKARDITERQMTREQIAEAQRMARDCAAKNYKGC